MQLAVRLLTALVFPAKQFYVQVRRLMFGGASFPILSVHQKQQKTMESLNMYNHFDFDAFVRRRGSMTLIGMSILAVIVVIQLLML